MDHKASFNTSALLLSLIFVSIELFDQCNKKKDSWVMTEKVAGTKRTFTTDTGMLTLKNFDFNPSDKQETPIMQWWWNSNNDVQAFGLRRADGMIFKNEAWNDASSDGDKVDGDVDEPYADPLNVCNKWD